MRTLIQNVCLIFLPQIRLCKWKIEWSQLTVLFAILYVYENSRHFWKGSHWLLTNNQGEFIRFKPNRLLYTTHNIDPWIIILILLNRSMPKQIRPCFTTCKVYGENGVAYTIKIKWSWNHSSWYKGLPQFWKFEAVNFELKDRKIIMIINLLSLED